MLTSDDIARFREIAAGPDYRYTESGAKAIRDLCDEVELLRHMVDDGIMTLGEIERQSIARAERLAKEIPRVRRLLS